MCESEKEKTKMESNISTQLVYLDLKVILANYKNPKFWAKKWTIFKSSQFEIVWYLHSISCTDNKISSCVKILPFKIKRGNKTLALNYWYASSTFCDSIPIDNSDYTQEVLNRNILSSALEVIRSSELSLITDYAEYKEAQKANEAYEDELKEIAEQFLNDQGVTHKDIREAYIDKYVSDNSLDYTQEVSKNLQYKVLPNLYLLVCSWFNSPEKFEEYKKLCGGVRKNVWIKIWNQYRDIKSEDWVSDMQLKLEAI